MNDYEIFDLGNLPLQSGATLREAKLAYQTYGRLNAAKDNAIVFPTFFGGQHYQNAAIIGPGRALDPDRYFIIVPNMMGNGLSSSPSNTPMPYDRARFPRVSLYDNVTSQHRLVTELFGIERIALVVGWSMGAQQTYQWGSLYPQMVERIAPICGSARTSKHNFVFLEGVKAALTADDAWANGWYEKPPYKGLRALGRVYAGWAVSQAFYREEVYLDLGYSSLEDYLVAFWEGPPPGGGRQRPPGDGLDLAKRRHQRQRKVQRRLRPGPGSHHRPGRRDARAAPTCTSRPRTTRPKWR